MVRLDEIKWLNSEDLYREEVLRARKMTPAQKILAGFELFDLTCEFAKAGIRLAHPEANEEAVLDLLRQRLALARRLEDAQ